MSIFENTCERLFLILQAGIEWVKMGRADFKLVPLSSGISAMRKACIEPLDGRGLLAAIQRKFLFLMQLLGGWRRSGGMSAASVQRHFGMFQIEDVVPF